MSQLIKQHDMLVDSLTLGKNIDVLYLDFSKAFDMVDHLVLLQKLKSKGFEGKLLMWIRSFLDGRKQKVRVGQTLSQEAPLHSGVPQGSVLGPLLFQVFIADLEASLEDAVVTILKYVDDPPYMQMSLMNKMLLKLRNPWIKCICGPPQTT